MAPKRKAGEDAPKAEPSKVAPEDVLKAVDEKPLQFLIAPKVRTR